MPSKMILEEARCPNCNQSSPFKAWRIIKAQQNPEKKYLLLLDKNQPKRTLNSEEIFLPEDDIIFKMRIVKNGDELREKIYFFDDDLDDRVIELLKCFLFTNFEEDTQSSHPDQLLYQSKDQNTIHFFAKQKNEELGSLSLPLNTYYMIQKDLNTMVAKEDGSFCYCIDIPWAIEISQNMGKAQKKAKKMIHHDT